MKHVSIIHLLSCSCLFNTNVESVSKCNEQSLNSSPGLVLQPPRSLQPAVRTNMLKWKQNSNCSRQSCTHSTSHSSKTGVKSDWKSAVVTWLASVYLLWRHVQTGQSHSFLTLWTIWYQSYRSTDLLANMIIGVIACVRPFISFVAKCKLLYSN